MKDQANREIKRVGIVATFFVLASLGSTTAQEPTPVPRPQLQDLPAQVSDGPTPFIRFVHTAINDITGFDFAQFVIFPKTGSATRPIRVQYAGLIWKREVISIPARANSSFRSSGSMLAAQTTSQLI